MSDYNGFKNKETWLVNLWFGDAFTEMKEQGEAITSDFIKEYLEMIIDECGPVAGFCTDLFNCAFYEIDYDQLANHHEEEVA